MFPALSEELKDISGIDIELVNKGMFKVALTSDQVAELKNMIKVQQNAGLEAEWFIDCRNKENGTASIG